MRFRLRTDFLSLARDAIRGGLWYKPSWWDAVQRVPPTAFTPRIKKRHVPRVRFPEDRIMREFGIRNPMLAAFDAHPSASRPTTASPPGPSLAREFANAYTSSMRAGADPERAYVRACAWVRDNGPSLLPRLLPRMPEAVARAVSARPETVTAPREAVERVHERQVALLSAALSRVHARARGAGSAAAADVPGAATVRVDTAGKVGKAAPPYRSFYAPEEEHVLSHRGLSDELVPPAGE